MQVESHITWEVPRAGASKKKSQQTPAISAAPECVAKSAMLLDVFEVAKTIAPRQSPVLLWGESGTGKEIVAQYIHHNSERAAGPLIPLDCANLSGELLGSELFGHVKGAFTGADRDTLGFFRAADGGTIFLDEIGELDFNFQARLLRVLEEGRVTPVGSTQSFPIDVRVLCATNRRLEDMVREGTFRSDLYYRINVVNIHIPPLRERPDDILPLAEHFLKQLSRLYREPMRHLSAEAAECLLRYKWPGNVRELSNAVERAYVLAKTEEIPVAVLPAEVRGCATDEARLVPFPTLDMAQRNVIVQALEYTGGRKTTAARLLGVERRRLGRLMKRLSIEPEHYRQ